MIHQPQFILVTGPNASGKTTFIEKNRFGLAKHGFDIIIPDNILKNAHSLYDGNPVNDAIYASVNNYKNFLLESPLQRDSLVDIISEVIYKGYKTSLIELLIGDVESSLIRVEKRSQRGGLNISPEDVEINYAANIKNVAENYTTFETSHFVNNAEAPTSKLLASFNYDKITYWQSNNSPDLKHLFNLAKQAKNLDKQAAKIIKANSNFGLKNTDDIKGLGLEWQ